jgi:hypothetical protein
MLRPIVSQRSGRLLAVVLVVLSQILGSSAVICDEGPGRQAVEFLTGGCCETPAATLAASARAPTHQADPADGGCGACHDVPLLQILREDEGRAHAAPDALTLAALPAAAPLGVPAPAVTPGLLAPPPRAAAVHLLASVVLRC